jgi:RNA polymerase sigma factor (sigma-70 family)
VGEEGNNDDWKVIWNLFKSGDKEAFAILYNLHIDKLYRYGTKLCKDEEMVKDSLQELFLELFLKRDKMSIPPQHLKYWLILALKRNLIKKLQMSRKFSHKFKKSVDFVPEYSIEFHMIAKEEDAEVNHKLVKVLNQLPSRQKEAIYLRFNESLEYSEIAGILDINVESVRKYVHRALKTVRELIDNKSVKVLFTFLYKKS